MLDTNEIFVHFTTLKDGRTLHITVNKITNRLIIDVVEAAPNDAFGTEFIRRGIPPPMTKEGIKELQNMPEEFPGEE